MIRADLTQWLRDNSSGVYRPAAEAADIIDQLSNLVSEMRDALLANQVFHTPLEKRRNGGEWDEYKLDAIRRAHTALNKIPPFIDT